MCDNDKTLLENIMCSYFVISDHWSISYVLYEIRCCWSQFLLVSLMMMNTELMFGEVYLKMCSWCELFKPVIYIRHCMNVCKTVLWPSMCVRWTGFVCKVCNYPVMCRHWMCIGLAVSCYVVYWPVLWIRHRMCIGHWMYTVMNYHVSVYVL